MGTAIYAFLNGVRNMKNPTVTYKMMRLRVYAQGFTFVALVGVPLYKGYFVFKERQLQRLKEQEQFQQASDQENKTDG